MIDSPPESLPVSEQVIEQRLSECGLHQVGLSVKYEDDLESFGIIIRPEAEAKREHFACIFEVLKAEFVTFEDPAMDAACANFVADIQRPQFLADLEARLKQSGLWDDFPQRQNYETLADFARALESHAGIEPGSMLRAEGSNQLTVYPSHIDLDNSDLFERYSDFWAVAMYAAYTE